MKKLIYLFILSLGITTCSSDDETRIDNSELIGKWNWISSCGGLTGGCWYPNENNYESIEFTNDIYIKKINGVLDTKISYSITDSYMNGTSLIFIMELDDSRTIRYRFIEGNLSVEGGDFWKEYGRITE